jgi:flagellar hook protein FlgE
MSILSSFNIGVTGLNAAGQSMSVIGDNIANAGTHGFKSSRAEFQDMIAQSLKGIDGGDQLGSGTKLAHITSQFTQGAVIRTNNITDLAINGNGFFQIQAPFGKGFTRDGAFHFDKEGFMVNGDGYKVEGFQTDEKGAITNKMGPIKLGNTNIPAAATKEIKMNLNLDSRDNVKVFDPKNPDKSSNYNTSVTVYDSVGTARLVTTYFNKQVDGTWQYHAMVDGADAAAHGDPDIARAGAHDDGDGGGVGDARRAVGAGGERADDDVAGQLRCGGLRGGGAGFDGIRAGRAWGIYGPHGGGAGDVGG